MRLARVLTYLNWLIGFVLLVLAGGVLWFVWRPLPKTSGEITAPLMTGPATITRDSLGVPHIKAASVEDAIFLQGYATAQDRLWQLEALRRYAAGELSEVIGKATIEVDRETRRLRMRRLAEQHAATLPVDDRRYVAAYARGVNYFIDTHRNALPIEFKLLNFDPREWRIADSLVIGLHMYRDLTTTWKTDFTRTALFNGPNPQLARELFAKRTGLEFQPGSNAFAISGRHTASGKPLLANDTHLGWGLPSTWYEVHLQAPGLNVTGFSLPGVPAVIIGHNERIAWGVTNLHFDVQDLYAERIDLNTGQYAFQGRVEQATAEREVILVKNGPSIQFNNWVTRHGPLWRDNISLRWAASEPGKFEMPLVQIDRATNFEQWRDALRRFFGPGQNFVYADVDGNIGYQATGLLPVRNYDSRVLLDGASGQQEWNGFIPFDDLPRFYNPPEGRIVTANQNPFPADWKYQVSGDFDPGFRATQIRALLRSREGWNPTGLISIQKDVYSASMKRLGNAVVRAYDAKKPQNPDEATRDAVDVLRNWNGQMEKGTPAPMVAALVYQQIRTALVDRIGAKNVEYTSSIAYAVIDHLLRDRPKQWFSDWDGTILSCLQKALDEGRRLQGRNVKAWDYGAFIALEIKHPVLSQIPWVGGWTGIGPEYMSGGGTTVKQTTQSLGPSMRFVGDTGEWSRSLANITFGESGQVLSSHYKDQWQAYWSARGLPMRWSNQIEGSVLRVTPER